MPETPAPDQPGEPCDVGPNPEEDAGVRVEDPRDLPVIVRDPHCPTCRTGPGRETVGMVCQTCGTDYAPALRGGDRG